MCRFHIATNSIVGYTWTHSWGLARSGSKCERIVSHHSLISTDVSDRAFVSLSFDDDELTSEDTNSEDWFEEEDDDGADWFPEATARVEAVVVVEEQPAAVAAAAAAAEAEAYPSTHPESTRHHAKRLAPYRLHHLQAAEGPNFGEHDVKMAEKDQHAVKVAEKARENFQKFDEQLRSLKQQREAAVSAEDYGRAKKLKDELEAMQAKRTRFNEQFIAWQTQQAKLVAPNLAARLGGRGTAAVGSTLDAARFSGAAAGGGGGMDGEEEDGDGDERQKMEASEDRWLPQKDQMEATVAESTTPPLQMRVRGSGAMVERRGGVEAPLDARAKLGLGIDGMDELKAAQEKLEAQQAARDAIGAEEREARYLRDEENNKAFKELEERKIMNIMERK